MRSLKNLGAVAATVGVLAGPIGEANAKLPKTEGAQGAPLSKAGRLYVECKSEIAKTDGEFVRITGELDGAKGSSESSVSIEGMVRCVEQLQKDFHKVGITCERDRSQCDKGMARLTPNHLIFPIAAKVMECMNDNLVKRIDWAEKEEEARGVELDRGVLAVGAQKSDVQQCVVELKESRNRLGFIQLIKEAFKMILPPLPFDQRKKVPGTLDELDKEING